MRRKLTSLLTASLIAGGACVCAHPGHDARSPKAWLGLGEHADDYPGRYDGYLTVGMAPTMRIASPTVRFDRSRLIALNSIKRVQDEPEIEEVFELAPPPEDTEPEEIEIVISESEVVEVEDLPVPIDQEDINSMYNEAGMLNPDDILLYLRDIEPQDGGGERETGGAFRFQLPTNNDFIRSEATFERSP